MLKYFIKKIWPWPPQRFFIGGPGNFHIGNADLARKMKTWHFFNQNTDSLLITLCETLFYTTLVCETLFYTTLVQLKMRNCTIFTSFQHQNWKWFRLCAGGVTGIGPGGRDNQPIWPSPKVMWKKITKKPKLITKKYFPFFLHIFSLYWPLPSLRRYYCISWKHSDICRKIVEKPEN